MAQLREKMLHGADGTALYVADWMLPGRPPSGTVVIMHGLGEHCGRYLHVVKFFTDCGFSVRTYDQRGHGKSDGARGDSPVGEPFLQDAQIVVDDFIEEMNVSPILFGHSMGGLFAARFALEQRSRLHAVILSSPALAVFMAGWQRKLFAVMQRLAPSLGLPTSLPVKYLSHDAKVVRDYQQDPLIHGRISANTMRRILAAIEYCHHHACELNIPCCLMVAGADRLVNPEGSFRFHPALPKQLATLFVYPTMYHEIFNEVESDKVFADLRAWLLERRLLSEKNLSLN
ncbi:MAG: lysophospholipase [Burkholderiales bacterium]|nr:lysophospholipase [Burkholderiales bacterium]